MVDISVVVPVWNQSGLTHQFLTRNWQLYQSRPDVEFVMVNNGSTDDTANVLDEWQIKMGDRLQIVEIEANAGFGPGNNLGVSKAGGDVLILLSNDVIPMGDYISLVLIAIEEGVLFGPELLDYDTGWNTFSGVTIPYLAGHCLFCTRSTWKTLGGFDERYIPCDYEDIDLSRAAVECGIELKQVNLPLQHLFGQSAKSLSGGRLRATKNNQKQFKEKWNL